VINQTLTKPSSNATASRVGEVQSKETNGFENKTVTGAHQAKWFHCRVIFHFSVD